MTIGGTSAFPGRTMEGRAPRPSMSGAPVGRRMAAQHGMSPS